jgi:hypothetical protein
MALSRNGVAVHYRKGINDFSHDDVEVDVLGTRTFFKHLLDFVGIEDRRCHDGMGILAHPKEKGFICPKGGMGGMEDVVTCSRRGGVVGGTELRALSVVVVVSCH